MSTTSELVYYINFSEIGAVGTPSVWSINLPQIQNETKRVLKITSALANIVGNNSASFPPSFALKTTACCGYLDKTGNPSNTIAVVVPQQINTFIQ